MKLNFLIIALITVLLSVGISSSASAQGWRYHGSRKGYTVYAPDTAFDRMYNDDTYGYYHGRYWRYHYPRKYFRHRYYRERRYTDYYYDRYGRERKYYNRWDDDKYYYRGGGY